MNEFQDGGEKSKWGLALKIGGIGCVVVILIGAVLGGLGVFKAVSCCSEFSDLAQIGNQTSDWSYEFALALHRGHFDEAREFVTPGEQARFAEEVPEFEALFLVAMPYPLEYAPADNIDLEQMRERSRWQMQTAYYGPREEEGITVRFEVEARRQDETSLEFEILSWRFERSARDLGNNRWVEAVRRFNEALSGERYGELQNRIALSDQQAGMAEEQIKDYFRPLRDVVVGTRLHTNSLQPVGPHLMEVVVELEDLETREFHQVGYLVTRQGLVNDVRIGPIREGGARPNLENVNPAGDGRRDYQGASIQAEGDELEEGSMEDSELLNE